MKVLAQRIKEFFPEWNKKVLSDGDLLEFCENLGVFVFEHKTRHLGEYRLYKNLPAIQLDPHLRDGKRLWVFAHEVGHVLFHHPLTQKFCATENLRNLFLEKMDFQANFFASVALIPKSEVKRKTLSEILEEYNYPKELTTLRKVYFERYGY